MGLDAYGYGQFSIGQNKIKSHRMAYLLANGSIPDGMCVLHKCDNPSCCNPRHLVAGTRQLNVDHMIERQRNSKGHKHSLTQRGENNGRSKLTEADVLEIRKCHTEKTASYRGLAKRFKIAPSLVGRIISREAWSFL